MTDTDNTSAVLAPSSNPDLRWYVVHAYSGFEKRVATALKERVQRFGMQEKFGKDLRGLKVTISWAYAESHAKPLSVPQGLLTLLPRFGIDVVLAHPPGWDLMPEVLDRADRAAADGGGSITRVDDMDDAFAAADVVYPKSWGRIDAFADEAAGLAESAVHRGWICDERRMALAKPDALYMHCLPADRDRRGANG